MYVEGHMKKLITTDKIGILVSISLLIYLLLVGLTEIVISGAVIMSALFVLVILRGLEAQREGKKVKSSIIFTIGLLFFILLVLSLF
jgi:NADH:ubiquinone oxidoreductase subunit 6 (subunit J)